MSDETKGMVVLFPKPKLVKVPGHKGGLFRLGEFTQRLGRFTEDSATTGEPVDSESEGPGKDGSTHE